MMRHTNIAVAEHAADSFSMLAQQEIASLEAKRAALQEKIVLMLQQIAVLEKQMEGLMHYIQPNAPRNANASNRPTLANHIRIILTKYKQGMGPRGIADKLAEELHIHVTPARVGQCLWRHQDHFRAVRHGVYVLIVPDILLDKQ